MLIDFKKTKKSIIDCRCIKFTKTNWFKNAWKSSIDWMSIDFDEQKNRLLIVVVTNSLIDWFSKQKNQFLIVVFANSRSFSLIHDYFRKFHDHSRWFTIIFANFTIIFVDSRLILQISRSFSLIHDAHNENEMQSSFSKKKFQIDDFI